jgi:hypothetical protein
MANNLPTVTITRLNGQLGRLGADSGEGVAALVMGGVAVVGGAQLNTTYRLYSPKGAEDLLLTAAYDTTNKVNVNYHISEFFRLNPTGELHIRLVAQTVTLAQMCDKALTHLKQVLVDGGGRIRKAGVVRNPATGYTPTLSGGLDADVIAAIPKAQELADDEFANDRPVNNIVIEGREFNGTVGAATDLRAIVGGPYRDVTVCIAQDGQRADDDALFAKMAAVGTCLGLATNKLPSASFARPISSNNLTSVTAGRFLDARLSSGALLSSLTQGDQNALHNKGYVFARQFNGYDGVYFNQSSNCVPVTDDYNSSELRDVMNYAVRLVRPVLIPYINSTLPVKAGGRIDDGAAKGIEADVRSVLTAMSNEVSSISTVIVDPALDDLGQPYPSFLSDGVLRLVIGLVPKGKAEQILVSIGYASA